MIATGEDVEYWNRASFYTKFYYFDLLQEMLEVCIFNEMAPIFGRFNFDYVFHYAALVGVKRTLENPMKVLNDIEE